MSRQQQQVIEYLREGNRASFGKSLATSGSSCRAAVTLRKISQCNRNEKGAAVQTATLRLILLFPFGGQGQLPPGGDGLAHPPLFGCQGIVLGFALGIRTDEPKARHLGPWMLGE